MDINPILQVTCDDCGPSIILDPMFITIFELDSQFRGVTICISCDRPIFDNVEKEFVKELMSKGVKVLSWTRGQLTLEDLNE